MAAFSFVQSKSAAGTGTAPAATFTTSPAPPTNRSQGDLLVCGVYSVIATAITMSSAGWTALTSTTGTTRAVRMFYKIALTGESSTVTATSGSGLWAICVAQYNLTDGRALLLKENSITYAAQTTWNTPTVSPLTGAETLAVGFVGASVATPTFGPAPAVPSPPVFTTGALNVASTKREQTASASAGNAALYDFIDSNGDSSYLGKASTVASSSVIGAAAIATFGIAPVFGISTATTVMGSTDIFRSFKSGNGVSVTETRGGFR